MPPQSNAAFQCESVGESGLPSSLELNTTVAYVNKIIDKNVIENGALSRGRIIVDLESVLSTKKHFKERKKEMKCLLYGLYNMVYSDEVITVNHMYVQRCLSGELIAKRD